MAEEDPMSGDSNDLCLGDILALAARESPQRSAVIHGDRRMPYEEIDAAADLAAAGLEVLGVRPGDRVAIALPNIPDLVIVFYGACRLGAIPAWVNPRYRRQEIDPILRIARPVAAIVAGGDDGPSAAMAASRGGGGGPRWVFSIRPQEGCAPLEDLLTAGRTADGRSGRPASAASPAMLVFTSGSTGSPKAAPVTHDQAIRQAGAYARALEVTAGDVLLGALPLHRSHGAIAVLVGAILARAAMVLLDRFDAGEALRAIEREGVTIHHGAPTHFILELGHPAFPGTDLSTLRAGLCSGYLPPEGLLEEAEDRMGIYLGHFWGSSETGPGLLPPYGTERPARHESVGIPLEGCEAKVVDAVTGADLPAGEVGELLYRGWTVMDGYWGDPSETERHFTEDRFFRTGDLALMDSGGRVRVVGRVKDQMNRGGMKVVPSEVEIPLLRDPRVREAGVVGVPDPVLGQRICACVVLEAGASIDLEEVRARIAPDVAPFKLPEVLVLLPALPRLPGTAHVRRHGPGGLIDLAERAVRRGDAERLP